MKYLLFFIFIYGIDLISIGQNRYIIMDSITQEPIPFATIKVKNKPLGFYADDNGICEFVNMTREDSLIISCVGYYTKLIPFSQILKNSNITKLLPKTTTLEEVVVVSYKDKEALIDYPTSKVDQYIGSQIALEMAYKVAIPQNRTGNEGQIVNVKIKMKKTDSNNPCRLHIYDIGEDGMPGDELLGKDIHITNKNISGKEFSVDLSQYNITTSDSIIFIGMEWLGKIVANDQYEGTRVAITHAFEEARTYTRTILDKNYQWLLLNDIFPPHKNPANIIVSVTYK